MNLSPIGSTQNYQTYPSSLSFNLKDMLAKAKSFSEAQFEGESAENLLKYIQDILYDQEFQSNPQGYLDEWREQRGSSQQLKFPEDIAREFFDHHFKLNSTYSSWCTIL